MALEERAALSWRVAGLVVLMCAVVGCGESSSPSSSSSSDDAGLAPPGSELGEDLVVPEGTRLVGSPFPDQPERSWRAVLLIEGDPIEIMDDIVNQAEASGLSVGAHRTDGRVCAVRQDTLLNCGLSAGSPEPERTYSVQLRWGHELDASYRHVLIQSQPTYLDPGTDVTDLGGDPPRRPDLDLPPEPPEPSTWDQPDVGEPVSEEGILGETPVTRVEGVTLVAPSGPATCITGGYSTVLRVDDDTEVADVIDAYRNQFEAHGFRGDTRTGTFQGRSYTAAHHTSAGGGTLEAVAVDLHTDNPLLLLWRCND